MVIFKNMVLGGLKKDNYKGLSKRMSEIGWNRTNDMCRREVLGPEISEFYCTVVLITNEMFCLILLLFTQILHLQSCYDKMVEAGKKTGSVFQFEPLRDELNDTFGAMTNVAPESVYSSRKGHEENPNSIEIDEESNSDNASASPQPSTSSTDGGKKEKKTEQV